MATTTKRKHLTPDGWKTCVAQPGNCRKYGNSQHMDTSTVTLNQVIEAQKSDDFDAYYRLRSAYEHESGKSLSELTNPAAPKEDFVTLNPTVPFPVAKLKLSTYRPYLQAEYDYDESHNHEEAGCDEEGICRCGIITNTRIISVDIDDTLKGYVDNFSELSQPQKEQLRLLAMSEGAHDKENYEVNVVGGYYGDEIGDIVFSNEATFKAKLQQYAYASPEYSDPEGILNYVRAKGFDKTAGMSPLQAIKAQLAEENNGKVLKAVANAETIEVMELNKEQIHVPNIGHYNRAEPLKTPRGGFVGVVLYQNGRYRILDGYHRLKDLNGDAKRRKGKWIVIR